MLTLLTLIIIFLLIFGASTTVVKVNQSPPPQMIDTAEVDIQIAINKEVQRLEEKISLNQTRNKLNFGHKFDRDRKCSCGLTRNLYASITPREKEEWGDAILCVDAMENYILKGKQWEEI